MNTPLEKGYGRRKRSQLRNTFFREELKVTGMMVIPVRLASSIMPFWTRYRGPLGPSGVMAISYPSLEALIISRMAENPPRVADPRMDLKPKYFTVLLMSSPSWWRLMRMVTLFLLYPAGIIKSLPCQKAAMEGSPLLQRSSYTWPLMTSIRIDHERSFIIQ